MITKELGRSGISLPPIMFGGNVFGWTADPAMSFKLLDALVDAGLNAIDTADVYGRGKSESIIGDWLQQRGMRGKVIIASKCGLEMGPGKSGLSKAHILAAVEASLTRLQTDYIDLYQAHRDDENTPLEETMEAFGTLVKQGKVRAIGASNYSASRLSQALEVSKNLGLPRYSSLQPNYNLVERNAYEAELEPVCLAEDIGVISYFSLASGFLTGKYGPQSNLDDNQRAGIIKKYLNPKCFAVVEVLKQQAARVDAKSGEVALAWLIARPSVTAPIASATSLGQLEDLVKAATLKLDAEAIAALDAASNGT